MEEFLIKMDIIRYHLLLNSRELKLCKQKYEYIVV